MDWGVLAKDVDLEVLLMVRPPTLNVGDFTNVPRLWSRKLVVASPIVILIIHKSFQKQGLPSRVYAPRQRFIQSSALTGLFCLAVDHCLATP